MTNLIIFALRITGKMKHFYLFDLSHIFALFIGNNFASESYKWDDAIARTIADIKIDTDHTNIILIENSYNGSNDYNIGLIVGITIVAAVVVAGISLSLAYSASKRRPVSVSYENIQSV